MSVISLSIVDSELQVVAGIPKSVTISANVPANIFYTLDGTEPSVNSQIYVAPIILPTNNPSLKLKIFATNGIISSSVVTKTYGPDTSVIRKSNDTVTGLNSPKNSGDNFPFGGNSASLNVVYGKSGGVTVDSYDIDNIPDGYDGTATGTPSNGTDADLINYEMVYSDANYLGEVGNGVGTLPAKTTIVVPNPTSPSTSTNSKAKLFNPRAMVIYQNSEDETDISQLNRASFSMQNLETVRAGTSLLNTAFDSSNITGSFVKSFHNYKDNTITYYYRDSETNQWIISKEPYVPRDPDLGALYKMVLPSRSVNGSQYLFKWIPFMYHRLI